MINIEPKIFTAIKTAVVSQYASANFETTLVLTPAKFPTICIEEIDNHTAIDTIDSALGEKFAVVSYEITIYTNKDYGKKAEARDIANIVDATMMGLNFSRAFAKPISMDDPTKYRYILRYTATISSNQEII